MATCNASRWRIYSRHHGRFRLRYFPVTVGNSSKIAATYLMKHIVHVHTLFCKWNHFSETYYVSEKSWFSEAATSAVAFHEQAVFVSAILKVLQLYVSEVCLHSGRLFFFAPRYLYRKIPVAFLVVRISNETYGEFHIFSWLVGSQCSCVCWIITTVRHRTTCKSWNGRV